MFGVHSFGAPYFGQGPGEIVVFYGPVAEFMEGANGPPSVLEGSTQQVTIGASGQNAVTGSGSLHTSIMIEGARE